MSLTNLDYTGGRQVLTIVSLSFYFRHSPIVYVVCLISIKTGELIPNQRTESVLQRRLRQVGLPRMVKWQKYFRDGISSLIDKVRNLLPQFLVLRRFEVGVVQLFCLFFKGVAKDLWGEHLYEGTHGEKLHGEFDGGVHLEAEDAVVAMCLNLLL